MKTKWMKVIAILLAAFLLAGTAPVPAFAAPIQPMTVRVSDARGLAGATVTVKISWEDNPGISSFKAKLTYDSSIVALQQVEYNTELGGQSIQPETMNSPVTLTWVSPFADCTQSDVFATLTFTILDTAVGDEYSPLTLSYDPDDIYNMSETNIDITLVNGGISVLECVPGDINGDGKTNNKDLTRMFQYLAQWNVEVNEVALDTNGDGKVNNKDLTRLFQYLAGWDVEMFPTVIVCNHIMTEYPEVEPTCTDDGHIAYWHCSVCGKDFNDPNGSEKVSMAEIVRPAGHKEEIIPGTSTMTEGKKCSACGLILVEPKPIGTGTYSIQFSPSMINNYDPVEVAKIEPTTYQYNETKVLPILKMDTYLFAGWSDQFGNFYGVDGDNCAIPAGTTGQLILKDHWISQRNRAVAKTKLDDPLVVEDLDNQRIIFCYEIGTIENVPLYETQALNCVNGMITVHSNTLHHSISEQEMQTIGTAISKETSESTQFTLSEELSKQTQVSNEYLEETGKDKTIAETQARSQTTTRSVSAGSGGSSVRYQYNDFTAKNATNESYVVNENLDTGMSFELKTGLKNTTEVSAGISFPIDIIKLNAGVKNTTELSLETDTKAYTDYSVGTTSAWNHDTYQETHQENSTTDTKTWNSTSSLSTAASVSNTDSISDTLHEMIASTYQYGKSYLQSKVGTEGRGRVSSSGETQEVSNTVMFTKEDIESITTEYKTAGNTFGDYRLIMAGTMHVFAVVGYDVAKSEYFVYTYNVLGDGSVSTNGRTDGWHEIIDYSYDRSFRDHENSVLPFSVPAYVEEYVNSRIVRTEGLEYTYNNQRRTATVRAYNGTDTVIFVPSYVVDEEGTAYKVTAIASGAFQRKANIEAVSLGRYVSEIPDSAFEGCTSLEYVICPAVSKIGNRAFYGCAALKEFKLSKQIVELGTEAFSSVSSLIAEVGYDSDYPTRTSSIVANVAASGANMIKLDLSDSSIPSDAALHLIVEQGNRFVLSCGGNTFSDLTLESHTSETRIEKVHLVNNTSIPLNLYSDRVELYAVDIEECSSYAMTLRNEAVSLHFSGTNSFSTSHDTAMVCKGVSVSYSNSGYLNVNGNIRHSGVFSDTDNRLELTRGAYIQITETEFNSIIDGVLTVFFDATGGECSTISRKMYCGTPIGELPTPTRNGYTFDGWFLDNGEQVTAATVFSSSGDITLYAHWTLNKVIIRFDASGGNCSTPSNEIYYGIPIGELPVPTRSYYSFGGWYLGSGEKVSISSVFTTDTTLYAHWTENPVSDWVLASSAPQDSQIIESQWTYKQREETESRETSLTGYTRYDGYWVQSGTGSKEFSNEFPSTFDTSNSLYSSMDKTAYETYENETSKRVVNAPTLKGYIYWHWMYPMGRYTDYDMEHYGGARELSGKSGVYASIGSGYTNVFRAFKSVVNYPEKAPSIGSSYVYSDVGKKNNCWEEYKNYKSWSNDGNYLFFRFNYYTSSYTDYYRVFKYYRLVDKVSSAQVYESATISNVQHWVKYRAK